MMDEIKDSVANVTTIAGAGAALIDWSSILTIALLITGVILNVVRIIEIQNKIKDQE